LIGGGGVGGCAGSGVRCAAEGCARAAIVWGGVSPPAYRYNQWLLHSAVHDVQTDEVVDGRDRSSTRACRARA